VPLPAVFFFFFFFLFFFFLFTDSPTAAEWDC
jgi:hypothetical protein